MRAGTIAGVILVAFLASVGVIVVGSVVVAVRGVRLWRQARRTGRLLSAELARFGERSAHTERLLAENEEAARELQEALERLRVSRARLAVLTGALERATARTRWLRTFLPA